VDLLCLRRRGIVRVQVAVLDKEAFPFGHEVMVKEKDKSYRLHYTLEQEDFQADEDFVPKAWDCMHRNNEREDDNGSSKRAKNEI
jgi:hypothetical protein